MSNPPEDKKLERVFYGVRLVVRQEETTITLPVHISGPSQKAVHALLNKLHQAFKKKFPENAGGTITDHCDAAFSALLRRPFPWTAHLTVPADKQDVLLEFLQQLQTQLHLKGSAIRAPSYTLYVRLPTETQNRETFTPAPLQGDYPTPQQAEQDLLARLKKIFPQPGNVCVEWQLFANGRFCEIGKMHVTLPQKLPKK